MFIHLSFNDIKSCIKNFKESKSKYLICSDSKNIPNKDISYNSLGECRHLSLMLPPFNLPESMIDLENYVLFELNNIKI